MTQNRQSADALANKRVFVTGHTGFKGSWLCHWLHQYGCELSGYALPTETTPALFDLLKLQDRLAGHHLEDVRDAETLTAAMRKANPELVFHLAAQSLVRKGYQQTELTWATNVMGTVNLLEAVRACPSVKAVIVVTTDKCYKNREWVWGYRENDELGGHDPYSASKAATELVVDSYRKSFFSGHGPLVASARAGNVIGGGDWSEDRLIPDAVRAVTNDQPLVIRNPGATRPWQHVLDCLMGYLLLAVNLLEGRQEVATGFNFGPLVEDNWSVEQLLSQLSINWPELDWELDRQAAASQAHEAGYLYLDSSFAQRKLDWYPRWRLKEALEKTAIWYRRVLTDPAKADSITAQQLNEYLQT